MADRGSVTTLADPRANARLERLLRRARNELRAERNAVVDALADRTPRRWEQRPHALKRLLRDGARPGDGEHAPNMVVLIRKWTRLLDEIERELAPRQGRLS